MLGTGLSLQSALFRKAQFLAFASAAAAFVPFASYARAEVYWFPTSGESSVVGELRTVEADDSDTLVDIACRFGFGYDELVSANPSTNRWLPGAGSKVILPGMHILPAAKLEGIVINLAELRLYYFPPFDRDRTIVRRVFTYPVSIGRTDWKTPVGTTRIIEKEINPSWYPPYSIRKERAEQGEWLDTLIPGGSPENPLGKYALKLGLPSYLIHGTDVQKEVGIGMRITHGCIRMRANDIEELFNLVELNTSVTFVDQPVKVGWRGSEFYMEVHSPLPEDEEAYEEYSNRIGLEDIESLTAFRMGSDFEFFIDVVDKALNERSGIPSLIARNKNRLPPSRRERVKDGSCY